jgi:restriction endonuclease Mrr
MVENLAFDDDAVAVEYPNRPGESVLLDRMAWARSYAKLGGLVETPQRGLYVLTAEGKRVLTLCLTDRSLVAQTAMQETAAPLGTSKLSCN